MASYIQMVTSPRAIRPALYSGVLDPVDAFWSTIAHPHSVWCRSLAAMASPWSLLADKVHVVMIVRGSMA